MQLISGSLDAWLGAPRVELRRFGVFIRCLRYSPTPPTCGVVIGWSSIFRLNTHVYYFLLLAYGKVGCYAGNVRSRL
jgi:hypothetical protein